MKDLSPEVLENAVPGNREGLADAYGIAAAWLRKGEAPPKELCEWLAERLDALAASIADRSDKKKASVLAAVWAVEEGKRGRKEGTPVDDALARMLVWEVHYQHCQGLRGEDCFKHVAQLFAAGGHHVGEKTVAKAWDRRKNLIPELDSVTLG
jgi:hypothetical protein